MWSATTLLLVTVWVQTSDPAAEGAKALQEQHYQQAVECFTKALAADPKDYVSEFNRALAYSLLGKDTEAAEGYRKTLELKPGLYQAELNLGIILLRQKHAADALPHLQAAVTDRPKESRPQRYLGDALLETGDSARAEQAFRAALDSDPKSAPAELGLARALARQSRLPDAAPHFQKAAELDPEMKDALLELASLYEKGHDPANAIALYRQFPDNVAAQERMAQLLVETGRPAEAIPYLEKAVANSPTAANRLALAQAYRVTKQTDKELLLLQQAIQTEPNNWDLHMAYGRELRDLHKYAPAAQQFAMVAKALPKSVEAWNELAAMLISMENYPLALAALDRLKELGAETPGHIYLRAIVLDRMRDLKGALENYRRFLAANGGKSSNEEFNARHRAKDIDHELNGR